MSSRKSGMPSSLRQPNIPTGPLLPTAGMTATALLISLILVKLSSAARLPSLSGSSSSLNDGLTASLHSGHISVGRCLAVHLGEGSPDVIVADSSSPSAMQQVVVSNFSETDGVRLTSMLKKEAWCAAAFVYDPDSLPGAISFMTRTVLRHAIVAMVGDRHPETEVLLRADRPVAWVEAGEGEQALITVACPTVVKDRDPPTRKVNVYRNGWFALDPPDLTASCPNPMEGQTLTYGYLPLAPFILIEDGRVVGGYMVKLLNLLGEQFGFNPRLEYSRQGVFDAKNKTWGGVYANVAEGKIFFAMSGWYSISKDFFDLTVPLRIVEQVFVSRMPLPVDSFNNLVTPFSPEVWALTCVTALALATAFMLFHLVYSSNPNLRDKILPERSRINFYLFSFAKITEPDAVPWFVRPSSGKALTLLWFCFTTFLIMFYCSNLRAYIIAVQYEKTIDTLEDVLENAQRGNPTYIYTAAHYFRKDYLEATGLTDGLNYQVARLAKPFGGYTSYMKGPKHIGPDLHEKRGVFLTHRVISPYNYLRGEPEYYAKHKLHTSRDSVGTYYECLNLKQNSPATPLLDEVIQRTVETGLISHYETDRLSMKHTINYKPERPPLEPMKLRTLSLAFMFFGTCLALATLSFGMEEATRLAATWKRMSR